MDGNMETRSGWWFSSDRTWRRGQPPEGWVQGPDGRWHSPASDETEELTYLARTAAAAQEAGPTRAAITGFPSSPNLPAGGSSGSAYAAGADGVGSAAGADPVGRGYGGGHGEAERSASVFALDALHDQAGDEVYGGQADGSYDEYGYDDHDGYDDYDDDDYGDAYDDEDEDGGPLGGPGPGSGRHLSDDEPPSRIAYGAWPGWARVAAPVAAGVFLLGAVGVAVMSSGGSPSEDIAGTGSAPSTTTTMGLPDTAGPGSETGGAGTGAGTGTGSTVTTATTAPAGDDADTTTPTTAPPPAGEATTLPPDTQPEAPPSTPATTAPPAETPTTTAPPAPERRRPEPCEPGEGSFLWHLFNPGEDPNCR